MGGEAPLHVNTVIKLLKGWGLPYSPRRSGRWGYGAYQAYPGVVGVTLPDGIVNVPPLVRDFRDYGYEVRTEELTGVILVGTAYDGGPTPGVKERLQELDRRLCAAVESARDVFQAASTLHRGGYVEAEQIVGIARLHIASWQGLSDRVRSQLSRLAFREGISKLVRKREEGRGLEG